MPARRLPTRPANSGRYRRDASSLTRSARSSAFAERGGPAAVLALLSQARELVDRVDRQFTVNKGGDRHGFQRNRALVVIQECGIGGVTAGCDPHHRLPGSQARRIDNTPLAVDE